jgi:hypothetical protein
MVSAMGNFLKRHWATNSILVVYLLMLSQSVYLSIKNYGIKSLAREGEGFLMLFVFLFFISYAILLAVCIKTSTGAYKKGYKIILLTLVVATLIGVLIESAL